AKQHEMRMSFRHLNAATEEIIYRDFEQVLEFRLGDVRDFQTIASALRGVDIVFNAAALKQVPTCEYFPYDAIRTNVHGAENIVRAIEHFELPVETVVGISTDKACKPINVMGMSKAVQERIFVQGNMRCAGTRFVCVRYGNVLASRGSVIPLFHDQIRAGGPVTITTREMTRFLLSLDQAVATIMDAYQSGKRGEIYVPRARSSRIENVAKALIGNRNIQIVEMGIRPGEKIHEILVAEDEVYRTELRGGYYVVKPIIPEIRTEPTDGSGLDGEFSSRDEVLGLESTRVLLAENALLYEDFEGTHRFGELLR
ncbi:MAG: polysaccharide biosynthesis protein, partial [Vicinamibacteria bacterium]